MNTICQICHKTLTMKDSHLYEVLKKAMVIVPVVFLLRYFLHRIDPRKKFKHNMKDMMKNVCSPCLGKMTKNIEKLKEQMTSSHQEEGQ